MFSYPFPLKFPRLLAFTYFCQAVRRVARRVASGGHSIPEDVIRRWYERGRRNLTELYLPLCDDWMIFDNSEPEHQLVAEGIVGQTPIIYNRDTWALIWRENG